MHYADAVWDSVRMNNIFDHFVTAWFDQRVKGQADKSTYFEVGTDGALKGFGTRAPAGLRLEHLAAR